jgi:tetratricopeptide (TPR) repeat protein
MRRGRMLVVGAACVALGAGCLEPPGVGKAADPGKTSEAAAPFGAATSNEELAKKVQLLNDFLDGKLSADDFQKRIEKDYGKLSEEQKARSLASIRELLESLPRNFKAGSPLPPGPDREFLFAQLYFAERRFIESAMSLSKVLDANPAFPRARNLLARCFFFLGNRDRTITELEYILSHPVQGKDADEVVDALYLIGAAVSETPGMSRENLEKGKAAWDQYLQKAPESPQRPQVEEGLKEIEAGLRGEGRLAQALVPVVGAQAGGGGGNVMGGAASMQQNDVAPMGPGSQGQPAPPAEKRAAKLPADASPFDRAVAEGMDALEARDLGVAEQKLQAALQIKPNAPEPMVGLGRVYVQSGRFPDALRVFGEVIKFQPDYMPAWHYNGMAHMMSGSPKEAVKSWERILEKDPAYAQRFQLDRRIEVARRMAQ